MYKVNDLTVYSICPAKYRLYNKLGQDIFYDLSDSVLVSTALRDTYKYYYFNLGMYKEKFTTKRLLRYFTRKWNFYKNLYETLSKTKVIKVIDLVKAHEAIMNIDKLIDYGYELIASDYPIERNIRGRLFTDSVDLIVINRNGPQDIVELIYLDPSITKRDDNDFSVVLKANFGLSCVARDLRKENIRFKAVIMNVLTRHRKEIVLDLSTRFNYPRFLNVLANGIEYNIIYPRPSFGACQHCAVRSYCNWKIK